MYLMIENKGVAPSEAFTLLGASTSRGSEQSIGQFGTGNKYAITLLLRKGIGVKVFCGLTKMDFTTEKVAFKNQEVQAVLCSVNGKVPKPTGWTLDWGALDWTKTTMAIREFIANAIDMDFANEQGIRISYVDTPRAKEGSTRVFVDVTDQEEIKEYIDNIGKYFLHFSDIPLDQELIPNDGECRIYRKGVYVCTLPGESVYSYNLSADEIPIDECRNSNEYTVRASIAKRLGKASAEELTPILRAIGDRKEVMEAKLDAYYLCPSYTPPSDSQKEEWQAAWKLAFSDAVLTAPQSRSLEFVQRKGLRTQEVDSEAWRTTLERLGIVNEEAVLSKAEQNGIKVTGIGQDDYYAICQIWDTLKSMHALNSKPIPKCGGFDTVDDGDKAHYFVDGDTIYICNNAGEHRDKAILQAIAEYVTGEKSGSFAFQDFAYEALLTAMR